VNIGIAAASVEGPDDLFPPDMTSYESFSRQPSVFSPQLHARVVLTT